MGHTKFGDNSCAKSDTSFLLPPDYEVRRKVMFSVCLFTGGGGGVPQSLVPRLFGKAHTPAGGTPLAVTQEDFLVTMYFQIILG